MLFQSYDQRLFSVENLIVLVEEIIARILEFGNDLP